MRMLRNLVSKSLFIVLVRVSRFQNKCILCVFNLFRNGGSVSLTRKCGDLTSLSCNSFAYCECDELSEIQEI